MTAKTWELVEGRAAIPPEPLKDAISEVLCPEGIHNLIEGSALLDSGLMTVEEAASELGVTRRAIYGVLDPPWLGGCRDRRWLIGGVLSWRGHDYVIRWKVNRLGCIWDIVRDENAR